MARAVPLSALATSFDDTDATLPPKKFLLPEDGLRLHRYLEFLWGLEINKLNLTHERSRIETRESMNSCADNWALAPTEETLVAMEELQDYNCLVPVSERKSFLTEFAAAEYEYIFVPLCTDIDFFIMEPGKSPQRFNAPYTNFPRVTSSANPFFVTFHSRQRIKPCHISASLTWHLHFESLRLSWFGFALPHEFLYPATHATVIVHGSERELHCEGPERKSGSDETAVTAADEVLEKEVYICHWARRTSQLLEPIIPLPLPPAPRTRRKPQEVIPLHPRWQTESKQGKAFWQRLFKQRRQV